MHFLWIFSIVLTQMIIRCSKRTALFGWKGFLLRGNSQWWFLSLSIKADQIQELADFIDEVLTQQRCHLYPDRQRESAFGIHDFLSMAQQPLVGQDLIIKASRSHSDTPHSVGLLWTSDQPVAETSTWQHTPLTRDRHPCSRRYSNPQSQLPIGHRPTP